MTASRLSHSWTGFASALLFVSMTSKAAVLSTTLTMYGTVENPGIYDLEALES